MFEEESDDYPPYEIQMPGNVLIINRKTIDILILFCLPISK